MSDTAELSYEHRDQLARIDRNQAETQKLLAETQKLLAEQLKLSAEGQKMLAEQGKLSAEERKFDRDRSVQTLLAVTGLIGGAITVVRLVWPGRLP